MLTRNNISVLVLEPANQVTPRDYARPNGSLGPAYLVGALRQHGIKADYLDGTVGLESLDLEGTFFNNVPLENGNYRVGISNEILAKIVADYDVVATSSIFSLQTRQHFEVAKIVKQVASGKGQPILTVSGGVNARALREHFLSNDFDIIALGEGEQTIIDIVEEYIQPSSDFRKVGGIAFRQNEQTIITPFPPKKWNKTIDYLPYPDIGCFPLDSYAKLGITHGGRVTPGLKYAAIQTSRGCQDKCTFCHISLEKQDENLVGNIARLRGFSKERVGKDVDNALQLGVTRLYFEDDNLFYNKKRLYDLVPYLKRDGLKYTNYNGANLRFMLKKSSSGKGKLEVDVEFIEALAELGLTEFAMPFESNNPTIISKYASGKFDADTESSVNLVHELKNAGMRLAGGFMIGFRDESWDSVLNTKEFAKLLVSEGLDEVGFRVPIPYPGCLDVEYEMKDEKIKTDFNRDPLAYTDKMVTHGAPLFPTLIPAQKLCDAVHEFWLEINSSDTTITKLENNVA